MNNYSRRRFLNDAGMAAAGAGLLMGATSQLKEMKNTFVHHVYFWLKRPGNTDDKNKLVEGLRKLSAVATIRQFQIGQPAATNREVIDTSYAVSWLVLFDNKADQDSYQADPIHLKFVEECSSLWEKVIVYDSVSV